MSESGAVRSWAARERIDPLRPGFAIVLDAVPGARTAARLSAHAPTHRTTHAPSDFSRRSGPADPTEQCRHARSPASAPPAPAIASVGVASGAQPTGPRSVGPAGSATGLWDLASPLATVQSAVDRATPAPPSKILAGTYTGAVKIKTSGGSRTDPHHPLPAMAWSP